MTGFLKNLCDVTSLTTDSVVLVVLLVCSVVPLMLGVRDGWFYSQPAPSELVAVVDCAAALICQDVCSSDDVVRKMIEAFVADGAV